MSDSSSLLRDAWNSSTGNDAVDQLLRGSLAAHASQDPEQRAMLRTLQLAGRSQLDLHIVGDREAHHETSALMLGQFLTRTSEAVRAVARSVAGLDRIHGDLNVLAPSPGSVRIVMVEQLESDDRPLTGRSVEAWSEGMERVASTFELADEGLDELDAALSDLDVRARNALGNLGKAIEQNNWSLTGSLTTRSGDQRNLQLSTSAARRLIDATGRLPTKDHNVTLPGIVDGWRWSTSTMRLAPDRGAAIDAFVPTDLQSIVADANAHRGRRVDATFQVIEYLASGSTGSVRRTHTLRSLEVLPTLDFDE